MAKNLRPFIKELVRNTIRGCPHCGSGYLHDKRVKITKELYDKRGKPRSRYNLTINRWSHKSIQFVCPACGLRFTIQWIPLLRLIWGLGIEHNDPKIKDKVIDANKFLMAIKPDEINKWNEQKTKQTQRLIEKAKKMRNH